MEEIEQIRKGITALMENFWIQKKNNPDEYMLIKRHKRVIKNYFSDYFGYQLFTGIDLFKVEKVPYQAEVWMGIQDFKEPIDYSIFVAILAYLEDKAKDDLFLISTMADYVKNFFRNELEVKWEIHSHRLSFYRAMKYAQSMDLIESLEGEIERYKTDKEEEILYRPTLISKYYMRLFSKPIQEFQSNADILTDRWRYPSQELEGKDHLQSLNRRLFFSPVVYKDELTDREKKYLNQQTRMVEDIPKYTNFELEIYRNELLLISTEKNVTGQQHPGLKTISDVVLQFSALVKRKIKELSDEEFPDAEFVVGRRRFDQWFEELKEKFGHGWSKEFREAYPDDIANKVLRYLEDWKFTFNDVQSHSVVLYPPVVRIGGDFPREYKFERCFIDRMNELNTFSNWDFNLPIPIFEEIVNEFNNASNQTALRLKTALDVVEKYVLRKDEQFLELDKEKIEGA
ncbi:TIGR02678 family protein [Priestia megaterium]|uniref:TIGR02678 family protein n=1 Tax=Priestia megaterium TaxID=1404 RepID=A0A6M6E467_PRIMG|nr:TIGR02678 family protein [Priestia megaterium]QJX79959.1 TIGR02678 family protein [Priestia megaterium]